MNKRGGLTDLFLFMIYAFAIVVILGIIIYAANTMQDRLYDWAPTYSGSVNATATIEDTFAPFTAALKILYWGSFLIIVGMILSIFIGNFLIETHPVFFVPYTFITAVAVILSAAISNAYETIANNATLNSTFLGFKGANVILLHLPVWITVIGFVGAILLFAKYKGGNSGGYQTLG